MNKILFLVLLFICSISFIQHTEARPLDLVKAATGKLFEILGKATYYDVEAGVGSCGIQSSNSDHVVAVNHGQMDNGANPNKNPKCNQKVKINGPNGKDIEADVVDTCPGCSHGCLDMSASLFELVCGSLDLGVCSINWDFV
ncbi:hypothetical protein EDC94DRAFT_622602 [Helicostylum pulchrum]|uniref:RlpA-like protein double-psi beta-barrel domain-containing protein n=1 Tax=Helicostylum pulchrum TaxID=562976 RepID=A0ABP9XQB9_9FUNG|nr:hypothetical protein EDC94DRAFT_622602 [Helicostylum pulchrum]